MLIFRVSDDVLGQEASSDSPSVIAMVNARAITAADLQLDFYLKQLTPQSGFVSKNELIEQLIDRELMRQFLVKRKVTADRILVEQRMNAIKRLVANKGDDLETVLAKVGLNEQSLEELLSQQIAWRMHVTQTLTETRINDFWKQQRTHFDGTEVMASQIFKKLAVGAADAEVNSMIEYLKDLKSKIVRGELTFAEAATAHSESPSASQGGDLGKFEYYGRVAEPISKEAFKLQPGQISEPFRTTFGFHLVFVSERVSGELSLEDARPQVVSALTEIMWQEQVQTERKTAKVQILPEVIKD